MSLLRASTVCLFPLLFAFVVAELQCTKGPCGPGNDQCGAPRIGSQYHIQDLSCDINDPNGPVYDPKHKLYHLFYQDHLAIPGGRGPVYGHVVSKDMVHWARLPVAIWNDKPYDVTAIYTGSATVVGESIIQVYPGLCPKGREGCLSNTGTNLVVAVPANSTDPFLREWRKPEYNPIVTSTQRDPTTAWQESSGEWRMIDYSSMVYGTMDWKKFYRIGYQPGFEKNVECPSFFPLPKSTAGVPIPSRDKNSPSPTHVYKKSQNGDWWQVGTYTGAPPKVLGKWEATPGYDFGYHKFDYGRFYASKDFYDPVKNRRILWGWGTIPHGVQTLPRELTWHPILKQIISSPLEEQDRLREKALPILDGLRLSNNKTISLSRTWPLGAGTQCEIQVEFDIPKGNSLIQLYVVGNDEDPRAGKLIYIDFKPPTDAGMYEVTVGVVGYASRPMKMLQDDTRLNIRVFVDGPITEVFFQNGRVPYTIDTGSSSKVQAAVHVSADTEAYLRSSNAWTVGSIWITPEEVLNPWKSEPQEAVSS